MNKEKAAFLAKQAEIFDQEILAEKLALQLQKQIKKIMAQGFSVEVMGTQIFIRPCPSNKIEK